MRIFWSVILLCLANAKAAPAKDCSMWEDKNMRKACEIAGDMQLTFSEAGDAVWTTRSVKSKMTDRNDVFVTVASKEPANCQWNTTSKHIDLEVQCFENTTRVLLKTPCHVASGFGEYGTVTYRIDQNPMETRNFSSSTDNSALGLWNFKTSTPFVRELFGGKDLLIRFTPFNENPIQAEFDIDGLEEAIKPLRNECGW